MSDNVNHPPHYKKHPSGIECIQITEHMGFNLGNALKYIWRCDEKLDAIEDLKKARWYIDRELKKRDLKPVEAPTEPPSGVYSLTPPLPIKRLSDEYMSILDYLPQGQSMWVPKDVCESKHWSESSISGTLSRVLDGKMYKYTRTSK